MHGSFVVLCANRCCCVGTRWRLVAEGGGTASEREWKQGDWQRVTVLQLLRLESYIRSSRLAAMQGRQGRPAAARRVATRRGGAAAVEAAAAGGAPKRRVRVRTISNQEALSCEALFRSRINNGV